MTDDLHLLTGAYALDALEPAEAAAFEAHLATCPTCPAEVRELQETAARLARAEAVVPRPGLFDSVMAEVAVTRQLPPLPGLPPQEAAGVADPWAAADLDRRAVDGSRPAGAADPEAGTVVPLRGSGRETRRSVARAAASARRWRRVAGVLAAAACVLAVAAVGLGIRGERLASERDDVLAAHAEIAAVLAAGDVATTSTDAGDGRATVLASESAGRVVVVTSGLAEPADDRTYQLWFIDQAGTPRSGGTFDPDARGDAAVLLQGESQPGDSIGLSVEPEGGSTAPTTTPLFAVPLPT
jgi:anti-sigma-K factor RskA